MAEWIKIVELNTPSEAYMAKSLLESAEINVILKDENTSQVFGMFNPLIGGIKLIVSQENEAQAIEILKEGGFIDA